jgi:D-galactarolactone isomerase
MNDLGIRGIRFNLVRAVATTVEMIEPLSKRVNDLGWHIQIHMKGEQIAGIEDLLLRVPSAIVFDHLGRLAQPNALDNPGFKTISKLIDKGRTWVKLSGAIRTPRSAHRAIRTRCRLPAPTSKPPPKGCVGERLAASDREGKAE